MLGVQAVDLTHEAAEVGFRRFDQQVIAVPEQAVCMNFNVQAKAGLLQSSNESFIVTRGREDALIVESHIGHMIVGIWIFYSERSGHWRDSRFLVLYCFRAAIELELTRMAGVVITEFPQGRQYQYAVCG